MSDARLTVKVRIQPATLADLPEPSMVKPPFSGWRIGLALLSLALLAAGISWYWHQAIGAARFAAPVEQRVPEPVVREVSRQSSTELVPTVTSAPAPGAVAPSAVAPSAVAPDGAALNAEPSVASNTTPAQPQSDESLESTDLFSPYGVASVEATQQKYPPGFKRIILTHQLERLRPGKPLQGVIDAAHFKRLYFFTELRGYAGQVMRHRWYFQGELKTEAVLTIEDSPWRTYSENWFQPTQRGVWWVEIVDQTQNVLFRYDFVYQ